MKDVGLFHGHLVYFTYIRLLFLMDICFFVEIWYIFPFLVRCTMKNLATLVHLRDIWTWFSLQQLAEDKIAKSFIRKGQR
jgi:hypothetical protein